MKLIKSFLFGGVSFSEREEYFQFRFRFFIVLLVFGALASTLFILGDHSDLNRLSKFHIMATKIHVYIAFCIVVVLRGRKHLYYPIGWFYAIYCFLLFVSAFFQFRMMN